MTKARNIADLLDANGDVKSASLDNVPASNNASALTTGTLPNARLPNNISDGGTTGTKLASGTTAQRGSTAGQIRFNTTTGLAEYYDGTQFKSIDSPPVVSSINPTSLGQSVLGSSQSIVITGSNFSATVTVKIIGNDGTEYTPASTTRNSGTQITITTPTNLTNTNEPYDIKVINASSLNGTLTNGLVINDTPVFSTASGSLGTLQHTNRAGSTLTPIAFSDEESTPTVSVTSGSIPTGLTLNSNGTFSGTANSVGSNTTSNFTVTATDGAETATRDYSIAVNAPVMIAMDYLVIAGGGSGGGNHRGGGGGGGGYRNSFNSETSGRNSSSETIASIAQGTVLTITVGAGGAMSTNAAGVRGVDSSIAGSGITTITSNGGGGGAGYNSDAVAGTYGSGAGAGHGSSSHTSSSGTSGQGFDGGSTPGSGTQQGGGGGGASASGHTGGTGNNLTAGNGLASSITGSSITRAGGGGAGAYGNGGTSSGGSGGGGDGGWTNTGHGAGVMQTGNSSYSFPASGTANTGGGGGGMSGDTSAGTSYGSGGSGVVILSVPSADYSGTTTGSPTVAVVGSKRVLTFNGTGSYTV